MPAAAPELIQPNEDERKNGWTSETLTAYVAKQRQVESEIAFAMFDKRLGRSREKADTVGL